MTGDDLENQLRALLHDADLPAAPASLRRTLAELPPPARRSRRRRGIVLLAAAAIVLVGVGASGLLAGRPTQQLAIATPPVSTPSASASSPPAVPAGFVQFEAPGIRFARPADWQPSTAFDNRPDVLGQRVVGTFARGMTVCPNTEGVDPAPTMPKGCAYEAGPPGTLKLQVAEFIRQLPATYVRGVPTTYGGYRAWVADGDGDKVATLLRWVEGPDDGVYVFMATVPRDEEDAAKRELDAALGTLQLSSWQEPPKVVDGHIHVETQQGFSFDYPAGWSIYYPQDTSTMDHAVVTVASRPVDPCLGADCQRFTTPPGMLAIEFRVGRGPNEPDWSKATETVGGQPASVQHWGSEMVTGADEGHQWNVRLDADRDVLGIYASLRGPGLAEQRDVLDEVIKSVTIDAPPPKSAP